MDITLRFTNDSFDLHIYEGSLSTSQQWSNTYQSEVGKVRITLIYTDYEENYVSGYSLINDLDLNVTFPCNVVIQCNSMYNITTITDNSFGGDNVNNVEVVEYNMPFQGNFTVKVKSVNVPQYPQSFSIVINTRLNGGYISIDSCCMNTPTNTVSASSLISSQFNFIIFMMILIVTRLSFNLIVMIN